MVNVHRDLLIQDFHNFFSFNRENSEQVLVRRLASFEAEKVQDALLEQRKKLYGLLLDFIRKYDWTVAWNLVTVFERRK